MKKYGSLLFAGLGFVLAVVSVILVVTGGGVAAGNSVFAPKYVLFAAPVEGSIGSWHISTKAFALSAVALTAWILGIVGALGCCGAALLSLKPKKKKVTGLVAVAFVSALLLIAAGVMLFFAPMNFAAANSFDTESTSWTLTGNWMAAAILALVGGVAACFAGLVSKK